MEMTIQPGVGDIDPEQWDRLDHSPSPFLEHAFLHALETSGSVGEGTGWKPLFVTLVHDGELLGAVPAYIKGHSYGDYIFDCAWPNGAQRSGLQYYPKLVVAVPFTPATGRRILLAPGQGEETALLLTRAVRDVARDLGLSSVHWLFCTEQEQALLVGDGWLPRLTMQYHWLNRGWGTFDDFLGAMRGKRRRELRRERRQVADAGITVRMIPGAEMTSEHWDAMQRFYRDTTSRKWGSAYLEPSFFRQVGQTMPHRVQFAAAERDGEVIAGALNFQRDDAMFGRYWGCDEGHAALHFECCYYAAIEYSIDHGLARYEAGAQGGHKIPRGFLPAATYSAHWLAHDGLGRAIAGFVEDERQETENAMRMLAQRSPFATPG
jgi:predicted N-acyltransferase